MLFCRITQEAERRSGSMSGGTRTFTYANWNHRTAAGGEDEFVSDFDPGEGGHAKRAHADAPRNCARAGCARGEAGGGVQTEEGDVRDDRVRGYRRFAERPGEKFGVARAVARGGCAGACGAAVRKSGCAA